MLGVASASCFKAAILFPVAEPLRLLRTRGRRAFGTRVFQVGEFAFVLFAAAGSVLPPTTLTLLNAAVAVSMLTTPLLLLLYEKLFTRSAAVEVPSVVDDENPVIIAGSGASDRWLRVLNGLRVSATLIDYDPNQVEACAASVIPRTTATRRASTSSERAAFRRARLLVVAIDDA